MAQVNGFDPNPSGQKPVDDGGAPVPVGVWGDSDVGIGVFGSSGPIPAGGTDIPAGAAGIEGHGFGRPGVVGRSTDDAGVAGESRAGSGVLGRSTGGNGVLGVTFTSAEPPDSSGVFGSSTTNGNGVTGFVGSGTGVVGSSVRGTGVHGTSTGTGVLGESVAGGDGRGAGVVGVGTAGAGVMGDSGTGTGVRGSSTGGDGVSGVSFGSGVGCRGLNFSGEAGSGVEGTSVVGVGVFGASFQGTGVAGSSSTGYAGDFNGDVRVSGHLSKGGGGFEIDHPLDPENKYLAHSFVESPEMLNVYSGTVTTDDAGNAEAVLPDYCTVLNEDFRYQLTVIGEFAQAVIGREVEDNRFTVRTDRPRVKVCWQVSGVRADRWAQANRVRVEPVKDDPDRGRYLHPELWGPGAQGIGGAADARRRAVEMLPEPTRERGAALLAGALPDRAELRRLADDAAAAAAWPQRTDPTTFADDWRAVQEVVRPHDRPGGPAGP
jgi:hypothetical protein